MRTRRSVEEIIGSGSRNRPTSERVRKKRAKVPCYCDNCNEKLVLKRTKLIHEVRTITQSQSTNDAPNPSVEIQHDDESEEDVSAPRSEDQNRQILEEEDPNRQIIDDDMHVDPEYIFLPRKRTKRHINRQQVPFELPEIISESSIGETTDYTSGAESLGNDEIFEDYSPPPYQDPDMEEESTINERFSWILLWIMTFRIRFNIPETATESLIKFMKLVLVEIGGEDFSKFPNSLYLARKILGLKDRFRILIPCPKCHKLYERQEVINFRQDDISAVMKCHHVEFPNSNHRKSRSCKMALSQKIATTIRPELEFPLASIQQQLAAIFRRPDFENLLRHWANRQQTDNILTDIYDGQVWKNFKETNEEDSPKFFRNDVADSHLGLMLNLDWFQPYDGTVHSTGVIYAAICNLPRDIRFKRENMLILGILPGPNEVSLHKINHYLAPIVDELMSLWGGVTLNTYECEEGKRVRAALILISCDIPAARKLCGHVSALVSCHRCEKQANYENRHHNFAGMAEIDEWFITRDSAQHRQNASEWRRCKSDAARKRFVQETGVRWSELLRLPYFDPIRFVTIDPMHCLFLGIAKWIVKRLWIEEKVLTPSALKKVQTVMNQFRVPSDIGRIPRKIDIGEGFSNFTADQWRTFFTIYATVALWEHLPTKDRQILTHFVRICTILVSRIIQIDLMREAHQRLIEIVSLIEEHYGRDKITPNLHLSLHLCECSHDFGPLYAFWCFSFERMNGILGIT